MWDFYTYCVIFKNIYFFTHDKTNGTIKLSWMRPFVRYIWLRYSGHVEASNKITEYHCFPPKCRFQNVISLCNLVQIRWNFGFGDTVVHICKFVWFLHENPRWSSHHHSLISHGMTLVHFKQPKSYHYYLRYTDSYHR